LGLQTAGTTFRTQVTIEGVKPCKWLPAAIAYEWAMIRVQLLVSLAIMLSRKAFAAPWPLALEGLFIVVRAQVTFQVEMASER
jgi:hypothetical protein